MARSKAREEADFLSLSRGKWIEKATEDTPGATKREKMREGKGTGEYYYCIEFTDVTGTITDIRWKTIEMGDGKKVDRLFIDVTDGPDDHMILTMDMGGSEVANLLGRLGNVDLSKPVRMMPYDMTKDGKRHRGVAVWQDGEKVMSSFFQEYNEKTKKWTNHHGFPKPTFDTANADTDDWKGYFLTVKKFMKTAVDGIFRPKVQAIHGIDSEVIPEAADIPDEPSDDLPF